ncbi:MAG: PilN domain-containing protein [Rhizobiales bacterium]|nr:PilN domain-containing protein [Hyphomicrobiales bacterium]
MNILRQIIDGFLRWMDGVATTVVTMLDWLVAPRRVRLAEQENGTFILQTPVGDSSASLLQVKISNGVASCAGNATTMLKGSRVELAMRPDRFFFRAIELPRRATEFLDGVVRAQIDRITPWDAGEAVFGWSEPTELASDRISVTVAAAARPQIIPLVQAIGHLGAKSIAVSTTLPNEQADKATIKIFEQSAAGTLEVRQVRRALIAVLLSLAVLSGLAISAGIVVGNDLQNRQTDVSRRIAERRGIIRAGSDAVSNSALANLARQKNQMAASVIVIEALSSILPDNTYVTELRIEGEKVQVVGISGDAPSLIRLIEQSPHFDRATFFAPTTRSPSDPGDRFHIEARIKPVFSAPS